MNDIPKHVESEKKSSYDGGGLTPAMIGGISGLTEGDKEDIVMLIIEALNSQWQNDIDREVCDGGVASIKYHLMKYPPLQRYPEYIVHHVLETSVYRAGILDMIFGRPVLMSNRDKATVII